MESFNGTVKDAYYNDFRVEDQVSKYLLCSLHKYIKYFLLFDKYCY